MVEGCKLVEACRVEVSPLAVASQPEECTPVACCSAPLLCGGAPCGGVPLIPCGGVPCGGAPLASCAQEGESTLVFSWPGPCRRVVVTSCRRPRLEW